LNAFGHGIADLPGRERTAKFIGRKKNVHGEIYGTITIVGHNQNAAVPDWATFRVQTRLVNDGLDNFITDCIWKHFEFVRAGLGKGLLWLTCAIISIVPNERDLPAV